jgi:hypothetical protein
MDEAVRMCGTNPVWESFDPEVPAQLERLIAPIRGDAYVVGESLHGPGLQVIQVAPNSLANISHEIDLCGDVTLIGVTDPIIGLVHHDALFAVVICVPGSGSLEAPRDLERRLLAQREQRREEALRMLLPPVQRSVLSLLEQGHLIDAIKHLRTALGISLRDARDIVESIDPWWPGGRDDSGPGARRR